jgi:glycosyltransferase involved in cell wall biosynthesis
VLSPKNGTFGARFVESGAAVRIGVMEDLLNGIRDVFCVIANTIMTANIVIEMSLSKIPVIWILHEWWNDEMIKDNLRIRNYHGLTINTVKQAMSIATRIVCVCESQRQLYNPISLSKVIYVGVPDPIPRQSASLLDFTPDEASTDYLREMKLKKALSEQPGGQGVAGHLSNHIFTFLCLGVICPRKNQLWTIELFKQFAKNKTDIRLQIVGARYTRIYEIEYLQHVKEAIGDDSRIELYDVSDNVDKFYKNADCLILTSLNEVTPMVIPEALSWGIPVLSTDIAGIREIYTDGEEGFLFSPSDEKKAIESMEIIYSDESLRKKMSINARNRYEIMFDLDVMVEQYRELILSVAPPVILLDMGVLVDWDKGFQLKWKNKSAIDRSKSYFIEKCLINKKYEKDIEWIYHQKGFFRDLDWIVGAKQAMKEMNEVGFQLYLVSSPVITSKYCAQEKIEWIRSHLGEEWVNRLILCQDKVCQSLFWISCMSSYFLFFDFFLVVHYCW